MKSGSEVVMVGIWEGAAFIGLGIFCDFWIRRPRIPAKTLCDLNQGQIEGRVEFLVLFGVQHRSQIETKKVSRSTAYRKISCPI